jgi:hypothetical protein
MAVSTRKDIGHLIQMTAKSITTSSELRRRDSRTAKDRVLSQPPAQTKELARLHTRPA